MKNTHIYSGILLAAVSFWCLIWFVPGNTEPPSSELDISPALVPSIAIGIVMVLAVMLTIQALRIRGEDADALDDEFGSEATGVDLHVLFNTFLWLVASVGSWLLMDYVGFEPAMAVFLVVCMLFIGVRKWTTIIITALAAPIVLAQSAYLFFDTVLPAFWR